MQVQELVGIIPWTFIAQICNLFIQMYLIKRFLFKPVHEILEKRRAAADAEITQAEEAKAKAEAIRAEYEQNMQDARQKANEILDGARKTAAIQSEKILKEAQKQSSAMKKKAEKGILFALPKRRAVIWIIGNKYTRCFCHFYRFDRCTFCRFICQR